MKILKTPYYSFKLGKLAKGCQLCVKGEKLVVYITGVCNRNCFYCPLSEEKKNKDVLFANEWNTEIKNGKLTEAQYKILIKEAKLCNAKGAGITGGDPLLVCKRTCDVIKRLKKEFGKKFHVHLYTSLNNITEERLNDLYKAGLDEIRVHPEFESKRFWHRVDLITKYGWDFGMEIPAIPGFEKITKEMIDYFANKIDFLNLNELEISDTNACHLLNKGFKPKNKLSYGVKGSQELALKLMKYIAQKKYKFDVHFCTCKLKDSVQLAQRIKKRAGNVAYKFDKITNQGILVRGVIYLENLFPGFSYRKKLKAISVEEKKQILKTLDKIKKELIKKFKLHESDIIVDDYKLRLLTSNAFVKNNSIKIKQMKLLPAVVQEYPTHDGIEIEVAPL